MELRDDQIEVLKDLTTHEGWKLYLDMLKELDGIEVDTLKECKTWEETIRTQERIHLLENFLHDTVYDYLREYEEDHKKD